MGHDPTHNAEGRPAARYGASGAGRAAAWLAIYAVLAGSWVAVWAMDPRAHLPSGLGALGAEGLAALCLSAARDASFPGLWTMWAVMGAAMMLPTALPALGAFSTLSGTLARRDPDAASVLALPALAGGYLAVWAGFAAFAACAQTLLSLAGAMTPAGEAVASPGVAAALLLAAGLWQFSPLKEACLRRCRAPMAVFLAQWRPGARSAFAMGARLGVDCIGCCWALMLLAFVGGTSNLLFMGGATVLMMLEKLPELGRPLTRPLGLLLIFGGTGLAVAALGA